MTSPMHAGSVDAPQLTLHETPKERAQRLLRKLQSLGLDHARSLRLTRNHSSMVSLFRQQLNIHEGYVDAPAHVLSAIVAFFTEARRDRQLQARKVILSHDIPREKRITRRRRITADKDLDLALKLAEWHAHLNWKHFEGKLKPMQPEVSRRMRSRLGYYAPACTQRGSGPVMVISRKHIRADGIDGAVDTLLHEMVHQWQDENGLPLDHGKHFRSKAREVGTHPSARRPCNVSFS